MKMKLLFIIIICIASFLRLYRLGSLPPGLSQDETSIGYNAYSILKTGKDEHGAFLPQNFKAFGEYKLPGYIYLSVIPLSLLGTTPLAVRLPSAFFGILTVILLYFLVKKIFPDSGDILPLVSTALLSINPWHIHLSRGAFEVTVSLFFITSAVFLWFVATKKSSALLVGFSIVCFALAGYTYNIARLLAPCIILFLTCSSYSVFKKFSINSWLLVIAFGICSFTPMFLGLIHQGGLTSTSGTMIWSSAYVQAPLLEWRSYFSLWPITLTRIVFNKPLLTLVQFGQNLINFFSPSFFFTTGSLHGNHGIGTVGQWYGFEAITILLGTIYAIKKKIHPILGFWIFATVIIVALTRESPHATRAFFIVIPVTILSALGILVFIKSISSWKIQTGKIIMYLGIVYICSYQIFSYLASYYVRFPILYAKPWRLADKEVSLYVKNHEAEYDRILIDQKSGFIYSSLLYYLPYDPLTFQTDAVWNPNDSEGFSYPTKFGKYEIRAINWSDDLRYPKTLIVTSPDQKPSSIQTIMEFNYPARPVVLAAGQQILQYPTTDSGYVLINKW